MYAEYNKDDLAHLHQAEMTIYKDFAAICKKHGIPYFAIAGTAIGTVRHGGFIPWDDDMDLAMLREDYERFAAVMPEETEGKYILMGPDRGEKYYNLQPAMMRLGTKFVTEQAYVSGYEPGIFLDLFIYDSIPEEAEERKKMLQACRKLTILYIMRNTRFFRLLHEETALQNVKNFIGGCIGAFLRCIPHSDDKIYAAYMKKVNAWRGRSELYTALSDPGQAIMWIRREEIFPLQEMPFEDSTMFLIREYDTQLKRHMGNYMEIPSPDKRKNHAPKVLDFGKEL